MRFTIRRWEAKNCWLDRLIRRRSKPLGRHLVILVEGQDPVEPERYSGLIFSEIHMSLGAKCAMLLTRGETFCYPDGGFVRVPLPGIFWLVTISNLLCILIFRSGFIRFIFFYWIFFLLASAILILLFIYALNNLN